jgi:hypothetical protein
LCACFFYPISACVFARVYIVWRVACGASVIYRHFLVAWFFKVTLQPYTRRLGNKASLPEYLIRLCQITVNIACAYVVRLCLFVCFVRVLAREHNTL